jgi:hypothetical protein
VAAGVYRAQIDTRRLLSSKASCLRPKFKGAERVWLRSLFRTL